VISDRDLALLARSPDTAKGRKLVIHGVVTQFDPGTGATQFRASVAGAQQDTWYDYDINVVIAGSSPPVVANTVKDDLVTLYVEVVGAYRYDTTLGGSMTVPRFTGTSSMSPARPASALPAASRRGVHLGHGRGNRTAREVRL
jgi:hypothetical protein